MSLVFKYYIYMYNLAFWANLFGCARTYMATSWRIIELLAEFKLRLIYSPGSAIAYMHVCFENEKMLKHLFRNRIEIHVCVSVCNPCNKVTYNNSFIFNLLLWTQQLNLPKTSPICATPILGKEFPKVCSKWGQVNIINLLALASILRSYVTYILHIFACLHNSPFHALYHHQ